MKGGPVEIERGLILGAPVVDGSGSRIGVAAGILVDPTTLHVGWLLVTLRADGGEAVVQAAAPNANSAGQLVVPFDAATVAGAPKLTGEFVSSELARSLQDYYGLRGEH